MAIDGFLLVLLLLLGFYIAHRLMAVREIEILAILASDQYYKLLTIALSLKTDILLKENQRELSNDAGITQF
ncbi:MAG: hypothetical protein ACK58N_11755 [Synechocystis sp.]|jgi:hypothetical protein